MLEILVKVPNKRQIGYLKAALFILCLIPLMRLIGLGFLDALSANPVEFIERSTGFWTILILLSSLSLTPIRLITGRTWQLQFRRMLGLFMFFYACLHITTYFWLDYSFDWTAITQDIIKHPYVLVGFTAFILTVPLAVTSNHFMIRVLRSHWKQLHQLVYLIAPLGVIHFWWLVKKDVSEPLVFAVILLLLFGIRLYFKYAAYTQNKNSRILSSSTINTLNNSF